MLKSFNQPLDREPANVLLLVEDEKTGEFLLLRPLDADDDYYHDGIHNPLHLRLAEHDDLALRLTEYLYSLGLLIITFRELARITSVAFSLADDTPGSQQDAICLRVTVNIAVNSQLDKQGIVTLPFTDFAARLVGYNEVTDAGIAQLLLERRSGELKYWV